MTKYADIEDVNEYPPYTVFISSIEFFNGKEQINHTRLVFTDRRDATDLIDHTRLHLATNLMGIVIKDKKEKIIRQLDFTHINIAKEEQKNINAHLKKQEKKEKKE